MGTEITYWETIREPKIKGNRADLPWALIQGDKKSRASYFRTQCERLKSIRKNKGATMVGIENLKKVVTVGAEALNVGSKMMNGGGILSLLSLIDEMAVLKSIDKALVVVEFQDLSKGEREELVALAKSKIVLQKKPVEAKVEEGLDLVMDCIDLAYVALDVVDSAKKLFEKAKLLVA